MADVLAQAQLLSFRAALARIGFSPAQQDALNEHGFTNMYNMLIYSKDQIKRVCMVIRERTVNPLNITMEQEQLLTAMRHWVKTRARTNRDIDPALFTREVAVSEAIKMVNIAEQPESEKESDVKMPDKFKLTSKWIVFSEAVDTYLNRLKGQGRVPLNYVIRTVETPVVGTVYNTEQELIVATTPLVGDQYDLDNERVYGVIKQLVLEGPAWSYITADIDRAKDGRGAWLALRGHYEGESFLNKQKEDAYKALDVVHYKGERSTFTFEHFAGIMTKAYNDLQRYGEPVLENKKVRDLLSKISDPRLESAKQAIRINEAYKNNFSMAVNFIAQSVEPLEKAQRRTIAEVSSNRGRPSHAIRGRGRFSRGGRGTPGQTHGGQGRGGRSGRNNRGRGRSQATTYIPPAEWNAMTSEQRQAFLQARAASRIHALTSGIQQDDISAVTNGTGMVTVPIPTGGSMPGTQIAQVSQAATVNTQNNTNTNVPGPFAGRAAHRP